MYLYLIRIMNHRTTSGLLRECLTHFSNVNDLGLSADEIASAKLERGPYGKPYLVDYPAIHFSVSHSGTYWGCAMGDSSVGLDLEERGSRLARENGKETLHRRQHVATRYFSPEEADWIEQNGEEAFFQLWVRKEAYGKFLGRGITKEILKFPLIQDGHLLDSLEDACFTSIEPRGNLIGACCGKDKIFPKDIIDLAQIKSINQKEL